MADYDQAFDKLFNLEGAFSNHAADRGGETQFGISKRYHPEMWLNGPPRAAAAREFYRTEFWNDLKGDQIKNQQVAFEVFESAVNSGPKDGVTWMQKAYNFFRGFAVQTGRKNWPAPLATDGILGPKTLEAVNFMEDQGYSSAMVARQNFYQMLHFDSQPNQRSDQAAFMIGWYNKRIEV